MCAVSNVHDHYRDKFPLPGLPGPVWPAGIPFQPASASFVPKDAVDLFEELVELTKRLDRMLGLPDCESAHKTAWMEELRQLVRQHEASKVEERLSR